MAMKVEQRSGIVLPNEQVEFGKRTKGIIDQITTKIKSLSSFNSAVAEDFFGRHSPLRDSRSPLHSVTFSEQGSLYKVEWASGRVENHGFSSDVALIGSHLTLTTYDPRDEDTEPWQAIADVDSHFLEDTDGRFLGFTGGNVKLRSGFVLDASGKNPPSWITGRPTTSLDGVDAIEVLPATFSDILPSL